MSGSFVLSLEHTKFWLHIPRLWWTQRRRLQEVTQGLSHRRRSLKTPTLALHREQRPLHRHQTAPLLVQLPSPARARAQMPWLVPGLPPLLSHSRTFRWQKDDVSRKY